jgi:hypothetical protein
MLHAEPDGQFHQVQDAAAAVEVTIEVGTRQLRSLKGRTEEEERLDSVNVHCNFAHPMN